MNITCKENLTLTGIIGLILLSGLALTLPTASADTDIVDDVSIEVPAACAFTSTLDTDHTAEVNNGVYEPNIGKTTLKVTCNDSGGFSIYAIGFTSDTYTGEDHTKLIGADTGSKISTKVYASSDTTSNWSMKLTPVSGSTISIENSFDSYHVVPDTYTKVATISSGTTPTTGASVETTYSAFMSGTQPADTYTGKVKYTMVHPSTNDTNSFVVNFFANGGAGTMSSQKISRGVATALSANTFTAPDGLHFAGWNTKLDGSGTTYADSALVTNLADAGETVNLYAMWQESCSSSPMISTVASGINYMQDINSTNSATVLSALTTDATYQIKDNRDNETYCVGKLADGKLWLLDNLALDLTSSTVLNDMNESNTNASNTTLGYLKNGGGTTSNKYAITGVVNWTDSPTYASSYSFSDPLVNLTNKDVVPSDATSQAGQYKVGGYYNYCAASAGSYCYGNGTLYGPSSGNATEDICPKGWRMPTSNTSGEYSALANAIYGSTDDTSDATAYANYRSALRLPLSGYFGNGSAHNQGSDGRWWSSTRYSNDLMYYLYADTSAIGPAYNSPGRYFGYAVRCVLGS